MIQSAPGPAPDAEIAARAQRGDLHPGLPLWGLGEVLQREPRLAAQCALLAPEADSRAFLERAGLRLAYRPSRLMVDDFYWQFCEDGCLRLEFSLGAGSYATAVLAELVQYEEGDVGSCNGSE